MIKRVRNTLAVLACLTPLLAQAELTVDIVGGGANRYPLAVPALAGEAANRTVSAVVKSDLALTGMLNIITPPNAEMTVATPAAVNAGVWRALSANAVLAGSQLPSSGGNTRVTFYLEQLAPKKTLAQGEFDVPASSLREVGHQIADQVYQALFGEKSFFNSRIAYVLKQGRASYQLQIADVDGQHARTILRSREPIISPAWSPDGRKLAYVSFETQKPVVWVQDLVSGQRKMVANFKGSNSAPAWSPDGNRLAVVLTSSGNSQIYLLDANGGAPRRLTHSDAIDTEPDFSPDGSQIAFTSDRAGGPQIYLQPLAGGAAKRISWQGAYNVSPRFAPDGKSITYMRREGGRFRVVVQDLASGDARVVSDESFGESPSFAPNGRMVLFASEQGGRSVLWASSPDAASKVRLGVINGEVQDPAWGPFNP
ncbi:Tol-Pal system beta propeller repeat protein TolB [Craterilacuibacter sp.]|uniref:Tol-Pal system beta propeller repeat protein TolB n=1 Tax=Craterilacuibacter sp. TaxID=2870909 RepID=UPI003F402775